MNTITKYTSALALVIASVGLSSAAKADCSPGFLANIACETGLIDKPTANHLDVIHSGMGRPLDHMANQAAGAAANYVAPGSGVFVTQGLEMRDQFNRGGFGGGMAGSAAPMPMNSPMPGYAPMPVNAQMPMPVYAPMPMNAPMPQVQFGAYCGTMAGRFGPGAPAPVGSFCQAVTDYGQVVSGQITF